MKEISLYVHIPFCKQKCRYCDFPSYSGCENLRKEYIEALCIEIYKRCRGYLIKTIFIGGGTPSFLESNEISKLLQTLNTLNLKDDLEFTIECNPGTLSMEKLKIFKDNRVNRLSIGLQSTHDEILKYIGRIHTYDDFLESFNLARKFGFDNINIDLMFALPNQTLEMWEDTLKDICSLNPEHISAYSLIVEEKTPFYELYKKDKLNLPNEDVEREMYKSTLKILKENGFTQYEISNFKKEDKECRHNLVYWDLEEYIGVGAFASGYVHGKRYKNTASIKGYIKNIKNNNLNFEEEHQNTKEDDIEEFMFMGLRKIEGVNFEIFNKRFNMNMYDLYKNVIEKHVKEGLLSSDERNLFLTEKGIELSNYVMSDFIL